MPMTIHSNVVRPAALVLLLGAVTLGCTEKTPPAPTKSANHASNAKPATAPPVDSAATGQATGKRQWKPIEVTK